VPLAIDIGDIFRATLDADSGNEGYIGISADGRQYHVVVPVDPQIARGIKAGNRPLDRTPFGGFKGWHYFRCSGYLRAVEAQDEKKICQIRMKQSRTNAENLIAWASSLRINVEIKTEEICIKSAKPGHSPM
jgi:hypothetical protein